MFKKIKLERVVVIYLAITDCLSLSREKHTFLCGAGEKRCAHLQLASLSLSAPHWSHEGSVRLKFGLLRVSISYSSSGQA
jgi:hypothetical protein